MPPGPGAMGHSTGLGAAPCAWVPVAGWLVGDRNDTVAAGISPSALQSEQAPGHISPADNHHTEESSAEKENEGHGHGHLLSACPWGWQGQALGERGG